MVEKPASFADNQPVFDGVDLYTRRGDFSTDKNGYLVNGAGYYLMGIPVDSTTGNLVGSVPQLLQFRLRLPAGAGDDADPVPGQPGELSADAAPTTPASPARNCSTPPTIPSASIRRSAGTGTVIANDVTTFLAEFDQRRRHHRLRHFRLAGEHPAALGQDRQRALRRHRHLEPVLSDRLDRHRHRQPAWQNAGVDYTFAANGQMSPAVPIVTLTSVTVDGVSLGNRHAPARLERPHPVRRRQRQRAGQRAAAERLSGRRAAVGVGQRQGPRGRHLFEQPHHRSRRRSRWPTSTASTG